MTLHRRYGLVAVLCILAAGCLNSRFYQPLPAPPGELADLRQPHEMMTFRGGDGTRLRGLFLPATGEPAGTVIHFHGNYGHLGHYLDQIRWLPATGFNVFTFDYRGYGRSAGTPTRDGVYQDAVAAIRFVHDHPRMTHQNLFLFGQSLGGANAIAAQARHQFPRVRAVIVEGTFSAYRAEARDMMAAAVRESVGPLPCLGLQIWPISYLAVTNAHSPDRLIGRISPVPTLIIQCADDRTVAPHHARRLFQRARHPKTLWLVDGCGHLTLFAHDGETGRRYRERLVGFLGHAEDLQGF